MLVEVQLEFLGPRTSLELEQAHKTLKEGVGSQLLSGKAHLKSRPFEPGVEHTYMVYMYANELLENVESLEKSEQSAERINVHKYRKKRTETSLNKQVLMSCLCG